MKSEGLVSSYTVAQFNPLKTKTNESQIENVLDRNFDNQPKRTVVVSDLTYVRAGSAWNYICILIDLFNREIIGFSAGARKDASLVKMAFQSVKGNLENIDLFHTDRGNEFKNKLIDEVLQSFNISRSLSNKGCPYDNAVAESAFKILKTEFINRFHFEDLRELRLELSDYVNWYNNYRIHSSLRYLTPTEYGMNALKKVV